MSEANATFHSFKPSGKWYATGRGVLPEEVYREFDLVKRRRLVPEANGGRYPGLSTVGTGFIRVIIPDDTHPNGFPLHWEPEYTT